MKKQALNHRDLQALYPPMPPAFEAAGKQTLSRLLSAKEKPVMRKKLPLGLVLAAVLLLALVGTAVALVRSDLLSHLFGGSQSVPQGLEGVLRQPEETVNAGDVTVTLNEYVFDGEKLHLRWSVQNGSGRQGMITMSPFLVDGRLLNAEHETPLQSDDHTWAYVLGGEADGGKMPSSVSEYTTYQNTPDADGNRPFAAGKTVEITGELYLWELLSPPVLTDMAALDTYEDFAAVAALHRLPVDNTGFCDLEYFCITGREDIGAFSAEASQKAYEYLHWARLEKAVPVRFSLPLTTSAPRQVSPTQTVFEAEGFTLVISHFAYRQTGGTMELRVYPKPRRALVGQESPLYRDLIALNADTMAFASGTRSYSVSSSPEGGEGYVAYEISLEPVSGDMPSALLIAPSVIKTGWDWEAEHDTAYDRYYTYILKDAVRVELK